MMTIIYVLLALLFIGRGFEQAILWSKTGVDAFKWNEHIILGAVRILTVGTVGVAAVVGIDALWGALIFIPSFWFWHNTSYYLGRHLIDNKVYPNWFCAKSTTSSAKLPTINCETRLIGLGISLALLITLNIIL